MKTLLWFATLCLAGALAHADLIVEQTIESGFLNGNITLKIKNTSARIDTPSPAGGQVTTIIDSSTGQMVSLMHAQKMGMKMDLNVLKKAAEAAQKSTGAEPSALKPVATGKKQKIGSWDAEEYTVQAAGSTVHLWVAANFPKAKQYKDQMSAFTKAMSGAGFDPNSLDLPGMVVKSEAETPAGKMTTTLTSLKEENIPASEFVVPEGYQMMEMPQGAAPQ